MKSQKTILSIIVFTQFCCTSLWFAGNSVISEIVLACHLDGSALGDLTSAVQFGFIIGTLIFAILTIADRFSPSKVFMISALFGALSNLGVTWDGNSLLSLLTFRFFTGFFLAGIYPVGMKIAADYFDKGLGKSLGFLVGALVIGTAFPHLLKDAAVSFPWQYVLYATSGLAVLGGSLMFLLVPDGPYRRESQKTDLSAFLDVFKDSQFRSVAFGYFGHMWELYAFWTFVPIILGTYSLANPSANINIPLLSFFVIAIGGIACWLAGYISQSAGAKKPAFLALLFSCICCLVSPFILESTSTYLFLAFLIFWGSVVIADSPLFSTLVAKNAVPEMKGTALTIVNCLGYAVTIVSIQLLSALHAYTDSSVIYVLLALGPIVGLFSLSKYQSTTESL